MDYITVNLIILGASVTALLTGLGGILLTEGPWAKDDTEFMMKTITIVSIVLTATLTFGIGLIPVFIYLLVRKFR